MKQAVRAAEARSRSVMLEVAEVMGLSTKCQGGFVVAAVLCGLAMRLPRASRAKPARLVLIPAADAFVPRGTLTPVVSAEGSRRRARLAPVCRRAFPGSSLRATRSSRIAHRPLARPAPLGVRYEDERLPVGWHHATVCRPGEARWSAGGP